MTIELTKKLVDLPYLGSVWFFQKEVKKSTILKIAIFLNILQKFKVKFREKNLFFFKDIKIF